MDVDRWQVLAGVAITALLAYATLVVGQPLFGVFVGALVYLVAWLLARFVSEEGFNTGFSTLRAVLTGGLVVAILGYSLFVSAQLLLGAIVAVVVLLVSWTTSPRGPLVG